MDNQSCLMAVLSLILLTGGVDVAASSRVLLASPAAQASDLAAGSTGDAPGIIKDTWIVVFQEHIKSNNDITTALDRLSQTLASQTTSPSDVQAAAAADGVAPFMLLKLLTADTPSADNTGKKSGTQLTASSAARASTGRGSSSRSRSRSRSLPQAALLHMPAETAELARSSPDVSAVIPDIVVTAAAATAAAESAEQAQAASAGLAFSERQAMVGAQCTPAPRRGWAYSNTSYCPDAPLSRAPGLSCPRQLLAAGETVPEGLEMIDALRVGVSLPNPVGRRMQPVVVAIMSSGIDKSHPQLQYAGGKTFGVEATDAFPDDADPGYDGYGLGTHNAGIVAAKNDGSGVVGVSPGIRVYSLKVFGGGGSGKLSGMLEAFNGLSTLSAQLGIRVAVFGGTIGFSADHAIFEQAKAAICSYVEKLEAAGVLLVTSAGSMQGGYQWTTLPTACPTTLAVTAIKGAANVVKTGDGLPAPADFSNFLLVDKTTPAAEIERVVAAPQGAVSIWPTTNAGPSTKMLAGTSIAAAHVAGVVANCIASGACNLRAPPSLWRAAIVAAAKERATRLSPRFGYSGDPLVSPAGINGGRYYGWLVWSKW